MGPAVFVHVVICIIAKLMWMFLVNCCFGENKDARRNYVHKMTSSRYTLQI